MTKTEKINQYVAKLLPLLKEEGGVHYGELDGTSFSLEKQNNERWYITVTDESGAKMYDGYSYFRYMTLEEAVKDAVEGSKAYKKD